MNLFRLISDYIIPDYTEIETDAGNNESGKFISITGSGGKTSLIKGFSRFLGALGKSVLITTSVKIQSPCCYDWGTGYIYAISEMYYDPDKNKTIIPVKDDKGIIGYVEEEGDLTK